MYNGGIDAFNILLPQPVELKNSVKILFCNSKIRKANGMLTK